MLIRPDTFSYAEMRTATNDFNPANLLGEGGFGAVFKVCLLLLSLIFFKAEPGLDPGCREGKPAPFLPPPKPKECILIVICHLSVSNSHLVGSQPVPYPLF